MSVDRNEVERIAELARLRLDPGEVARLTGEMNRILEHAQRLRTVTERGAADRSEAFEQSGGRVTSDLSGARASEDVEPDVLVRSPPAFAPDIREGFFVVPPPPGIVPHREHDPSGGEG